MKNLKGNPLSSQPRVFQLSVGAPLLFSIAFFNTKVFAMKNLVTDLDELCKLLWRGVEIFACLRRRHDAH